MSDSPPSTCSVQFVDSSNLIMNNPPVGTVKPKESWCSSSKLITSPPHESIVAYHSSSFGITNYKITNPCQDDKITLCKAQDHILAERKRRQKLNQRFIALSTLIPGLKKMDKASVLGDAITYMKQLQEKVKTLEEQTKKTTMESVVFAVKKYGDHHSEKTSSSDESFSSVPIITESLPVIEARFCDKDVLISIHCEKRKGVLEKIVAEIEKFHLSVVNSSVMTYGVSALNVTVIAERDEEFTMSMKEFVKNLGSVLKIFM